MLTKSEVGKYRLKFMPEALGEWNALDGGAKGPLRKALKKRLEQPHVPGSRLHGDLANCYKRFFLFLVYFRPCARMMLYDGT